MTISEQHLAAAPDADAAPVRQRRWMPRAYTAIVVVMMVLVGPTAGATAVLSAMPVPAAALQAGAQPAPQPVPEPATPPAPLDAPRPPTAQPPTPAPPPRPPVAAPQPAPGPIGTPTPTPTPTPAETTDAAPTLPGGAREPDAFVRCDDWSQRPVFKLGQDHRVRAGESVREAVVVFGSVVVEGDVCGDLVVVFGNVDLASTAYVRDTLSVVGGRFTAAEGARVEGDLVVVGGAMEAPASFGAGGEQVLVGVPFIGDRLLGVVPWLTRGLIWGRLIVPDLAWNWWVVAITLFVVLVLNLLFPRATGLSTTVIQERPLSAFAAGLLVLLLSGPVVTLLAVSVIGTAVIPFVALGMVAAWTVGSIAVARWIGASLVGQHDPFDRPASTRSLLLGFFVKVVAYMIPVVGLTTWALAGVLGLGAATMAFINAFKAENPRRTPPPPPPPPPPLFPADRPPLDEGLGDAPPPDEPGVADRLREEITANGDLRRFPRGSFLERLGAFVLDAILVAFISGVLDLSDRDGLYVVLLVAYHVAFWSWKGTTIGGLIVQLRLVRVDGRPLEFTDALVRGLTGIFSIGALGLGGFWILKDEQRQAWHDLVAGTLVVRVPRGWPLP